MRALLLMTCSIALSCAGPPTSDTDLRLEFAPDAPIGDEAITCFGFDAAEHAGRVVCGLEFSIAAGAAPLHHAILYADPTRDFAGEVPCDLPPPASTSLGGWLPGASSTVVLPDDVGMLVPDATQTFVVQAHAIRANDGPVMPSSVVVHFCETPPAHVAASIALVADVPVIAPRTAASASVACAIATEAHVVRLWPHMHRAGTEIAVMRSHDATPMVDVTPWDFAHQVGYLTGDTVLAPGDTLSARCDWFNGTDEAIEPGPFTRNEMCSVGVLVWPAGAQWTGCQ